VDANVFIAAFLRDSTMRKIVVLSGLQLLVPEYLFEEFEAHIEELCQRSGLDEHDARQLIDRLVAYLTVVPEEVVWRGMPEALELMGGIDQKDAPYLATALVLSCDGVWSDNPDVKEQQAVRCWTTPELVEELRKAGFRL
jgi:predicted nucleic acid-binding protein